ncbi:MAG: PHP domain-containing protein [Firmicutes bacterium]|nr:PHP domain-containing protein [Bacillota bacterium]
MEQSVFKFDKWFKGNLHCHSTVSDGRLEPRSVAELYKRSGWNFLAFTDHEMYTDREEYNDDHFIILPGIEIAMEECGHIDKCHHAVGIHRSFDGEQGSRHMERFRHGADFQGSLNQLMDADYMAIYCHPVWSRAHFQDLAELDGFFAMEIYNNACELESRTGLAVAYWDFLLRKGRRVWGVASDDAHHILTDRCGGWVMVNAPSLTRADITKALYEGRFYSSTGPQIYAFGIRGDKCIVQCSPVESIHFISYERRGRSYHAHVGREISSAVHTLHGDETFVRVECVDRYGRTAWSNPIFLEK